MSNNSHSNISRRRAPPPSTQVSHNNAAFFLIRYAFTSLTLILPDSWRNRALDHPNSWLLLTTSLKTDMTQLCNLFPKGSQEYSAYVAVGQHCFDTANLTLALFSTYEWSREISVFFWRKREKLAVQASLYLDLLLYTKKKAYMGKTGGINRLLYCSPASALRISTCAVSGQWSAYLGLFPASFFACSCCFPQLWSFMNFIGCFTWALSLICWCQTG